VASRRFRSKSSLNSNLTDINSKISKIYKRPEARKIANESITNVSIKEATIVGQNLADNSVTKVKLGEDVFSNSTFSGTATFSGTVVGTPAEGTNTTAATGFGYKGVPQSSGAGTTGAYTITASDAGEHIYASATRTISIPANSSVPLAVGTTVVFIAGTGATITISITTDTLYLAGSGATGTRTIAPFGLATAVKITSTSWIISGSGLS
jgi:hypothetical protein